MKKKIIFILTILLVFVSFIPKADARLGGSSRGAASGLPKPQTDPNALPARCSSLRNEELSSSFSSIVGILFNIVEYNHEVDNPEPHTVARVLFNGGSFGPSSITVQCSETDMLPPEAQDGSSGPASPLYEKERISGDTDLCAGGKGYVYKWYRNVSLTFEYNFSMGSLEGIPVVNYPFDIDFNDLPGSLEGDNGMLKMLLAMDAEHGYTDSHWGNLKTINRLYGTNITEENIEKYYIIVEPVYRYYQSAISGDYYPFDLHYNPDKTEYSAGDNWSDYLLEEHEITKTVQGTDAYCSPSLGEGVSVTEENCDAAGGEWHPKVDTKESLCKYYTQIAHRGITYGTMSSYLLTAREGGGYLDALYNVYSNNNMEAKNQAGNPIEGKTDYFIGTNIDTAMVTETLPGSGNLTDMHSYTLKKGITKTIRSYYQFAANSNDKVNIDRKTMGMAVYAMIDIFGPPDEQRKKCSDYCAHVQTGKSSDEYLLCAQSFCDSYADDFVKEASGDKHYTTAKRDCIKGNGIYACGYIPKKPIDCSEGSGSIYDTSFKNLAAGTAAGQDITGSYCGYTSKTSSTRTSDSASKTGGYVQCERLGNKTKQTVNGVKVYAYGTSNTQNSYINAACKEYSSFDFEDTSKKTLKPGDGISYYVNLRKGIRECILFFDYEQWKFDFASTYSGDAIRKTLLLNKVKAYNELVKTTGNGVMLNGSNIGTNVLTREVLDEDEDGNIFASTVAEVIKKAEGDDFATVKILEYNTSDEKASVNTTVTEYVNSSPYYGGNKPYSSDNGTSISMEKIKVEASSQGKMFVKSGEDTLKLYTLYDDNKLIQLDRAGTMQVNRYKYYGTVDIDYNFPEVCLSDDNSGTVINANTGNCTSTKFGDLSKTRLYYTHPNATTTESLPSNTNHTITSTVNVYPYDFSETKGTTSYLTGSDSCIYKVYDIPPPDTCSGKVSCTLTLNRKPDSGEAKYSYNNQACYNATNVYITEYEKASVKMMITNNTSNDEQISSYGIVANDLSGNELASVSNKTEIKIPVSNLKYKKIDGKLMSDSQVIVTGKVITKKTDGTTCTYTCDTSATIAKMSAGCTITKDSKKYEVTGAADGEKVYVTTGNEQWITDDLVFTEVFPTSGHYYVYNLNKKGNEIVIARIGSGTSARYCVYKPTSCPPTPQNNNCHKACEDSTNKYKCAMDYCSNEGLNDEYPYYPDCLTECTRETPDPEKYPCTYYIQPDKREDYEYVSSWCNNSSNLSQTTHSEADECIDYCYDQSGTETYRPINLNNPFPNSEFSTSDNYVGGNRAIGKSWQNRYNVLIERRTEISKAAKDEQAEYIVELTPSMINKINADTDSYNATHTDSSVYTTTGNATNAFNDTTGYYVCYTGKNEKKYTGYCSKFIRQSTFSSIFKKILGLNS